jgi:hypothetical protein
MSVWVNNPIQVGILIANIKYRYISAFTREADWETFARPAFEKYLSSSPEGRTPTNGLKVEIKGIFRSRATN